MSIIPQLQNNLKNKLECIVGLSVLFPHYLGQAADNEQEVFVQYLSRNVPTMVPGTVKTNKSCS